ncbi:MAG: tetratricopeptide repeat protein [Spirochaetaceae bacterium]|nr:tetratricopeptide repeat protein [Spirochaetaceae bacterium]
MFYIALEINGCKQREKTEGEFMAALWKAVDEASSLRGGRRTPTDEDHFVLCFDAQDSGDAQRVLDAAWGVREVLVSRAESLTGFLLLAEFFPPDTKEETAFRELRRMTGLREIDDSLLLGPAGVELFRPYCETKKSGGLARVIRLISKDGQRLGTAAEFCLRETVVEDLRQRLRSCVECAQSPRLFFVHGPALSGLRYTLEAALAGLVDRVCRISPLPGRIFPALEFPGFEEAPRVLSAAEKKLWQEKKALFEWKRTVDFPFEEALSAYSLAITAYTRLCEKDLVPAVVVCEDLHAMPETAKKFLALVIQRNLPEWRIVPVCDSREESPGPAFANIPAEDYALPPVDSAEIRSLIGRLAGKKSISGLVSARRASAGILALYFEFLAQGGRSGEEEESPFEPILRFVKAQEKPLREILYVIQEASGAIPPPRLEEFLLTHNFTPAQCSDIIRRLVEAGLVRDAKRLVPVFPELRPLLRKDPALQKSKIAGNLAGFLYTLWKEGGGGEIFLLEFLAETHKEEWFSEVFQEYAAELLEAGAVEEARRLLAADFPIVGGSAFKLATASARLRLALLAGDEEASGAAFLLINASRQNSPYYGESLICKTSYWLKKGDAKEALGCAKNAVMLFQETPAGKSLARAHTAVGLAMLAAGNPEQAIDYFLMARESEGASARTIFLEGVCRFIMGNYTQALGNFGLAAELADSRYARRWSMAAGFMEGRIFFELGEYEQAAAAFELLLSTATSFQYAAPVPLAYAWLARSLAYQDDVKVAMRILTKCDGVPEAPYFRAEADYFRKEYRKARDWLQPYLGAAQQPEYFFGEGPAWKDGFYFAENTLIGRQGGSFLLPNLMRFFHAYLWGLGPESSSGIEMMSRLLHDEKTSRNDPCLRLYYYWYFRILPLHQNPAFEDRLTVLGRAMQNLQSQTSRMDSPVHKRAFTGKNAWNRLLVEDARQNNLV